MNAPVPNIQNILAPEPIYNLNQGQKDAADAFFQFLFAPEKEFIISGPAGTGKTYLMNYIIDNTMPRYLETCKLIGIDPIYHGVTMTATTNKAADVLSQATSRPTQTVHSFFNLTIKENFSTGKQELKKTNQWKVHDKLIIFVDECSMIDTELYKVLHEGTTDCKLVYVGDHNQLAPVQESLSPVYKHNAPMFELTQQMRNAGQPALMDVCQQLRDTVETGSFQPIQVVPGVIDLLDGPAMQRAIDQAFKQQTHDSRILAYTNGRVIEYNTYIRELRNLPPDTYLAGEYLVNNSSFRQGANAKTLSVEANVIVRRNSGMDQIEVEKGVYLDVNYLDFDDDLGIPYTHIPIATNRKHYQDLLKYYSRIKNWERFFFLKNSFVDLRPRDAATVHKSQGSTYDTVFMDLSNISTCNISNQVARMLYVAFSRARNRVFLYGNLASKYGGLVLP